VAKAAARADCLGVLTAVFCCCGCRGGLAGTLGAAAAWADAVLNALRVSQSGTQDAITLNSERLRRAREQLQREARLDGAGAAQHYASVSIPEGADTACVRRVAELLRASPSWLNFGLTLLLRAAADVAWDTL